jgi:nucleoid DNA-binding protein
MANRLNLESLREAIELHDAFKDDAPKYKVEDVIRTLFAAIEAAVVADDKVAIPGFGTFTKFTSSTTSKSKPKFTPSSTFKDKVNG